MLFALIFICNIGVVAERDDAHSVWSTRVPGLSATNEECHRSAIAYLHSIDVRDFLEPNKSYEITVSCREGGI